MNDDDLYGPKLTAPPSTAPIVRGVAAALVVGAVLTVGCSESHAPGVLVADAGISIGDSGSPGRTVVDAGISVSDAGNPGANPGTAPLDGGSGP